MLIVARVINEHPRIAPERREVMMDLTAAHANGCPLDLRGLILADAFDFAHDVFGIMDHIDRRTGQVLGFFVPRYAQANHPKATEAPSA
jgi:hypothetical protein